MSRSKDSKRPERRPFSFFTLYIKQLFVSKADEKPSGVLSLDTFDVEAVEVAEAAYEAGVRPDQAARLERLAKELAAAVRGPEAKRELEKADKEKRDANSLKLYAQDQRREIDGTTARVAEDMRAHLGSRL